MKNIKMISSFVLLFMFTMMIAISCDKVDPNSIVVKTEQDDRKNDIENNTNKLEENKSTLEANDEVEKEEGNDSTGLSLNIKDFEKDEMIPKENPREMKDITSIELIKEMNIGWNLGNTLDATGSKTILSETSWGNPKTTKEMIDMVKGAGFNVIRIPTTWEIHMGPAPEYKIDTAWMNRVKEVVDYGIDNEMYVILNIHLEEWHFPSNDNYNNAKDILVKIWTQIADRFDYYDEHLIFEGMNEPRMKGTSYEWNGGTPEGREIVSKLNLDFIETIRNSSGNNLTRHLMIPAYAASSDQKTWQDLILPEDDRIIVSVHAYTPYNFALNDQGTDEWSIINESDTRDIDNLMQNIKGQFIDKGIPVILGEFGARNKDNLESRVNWANYYITKSREIGVPCIWWDNGAFEGNGENFGLLNRRELTWRHPEIVQSLMEGLK